MMIVTLGFFALCAVICFGAYFMAIRGKPAADAADTEPPSEYAPDLTSRTRKELWESIK